MGVSQKGTPRGYRGIIRGLYRAPLRDYIEVILRNTQMVCSVRRGGGGSGYGGVASLSGVPTRIAAFWGLYWGLPIQASYQRSS